MTAVRHQSVSTRAGAGAGREMVSTVTLQSSGRAQMLSRRGDRQVLVALALLGEFRHVPETLWYREAAGFSYKRQRRMFFPDHIPLHTYLPANVQHFGVLLWDFVVRGRGRPAVSRARGRVRGCGRRGHGATRRC